MDSGYCLLRMPSQGHMRAHVHPLFVILTHMMISILRSSLVCSDLGFLSDFPKAKR